MISKVNATIQKYFLVRKNDSVLLAVSGGPDSVAMVYVFKELQKDYNLKLALAYFHHGIRPESDSELEFVKKLASDFKFSFYSKKENIPKIVKEEKRSLEEIARMRRYQFLIQTAKRNGYRKIAVAHNRDDQVETFLHRLIRGAGLKGLCAIPVRIEIQGIVVIRPLIEIPRQEIERYLQKLKVIPCIDTTNYDTRFIRNKIRQELIPYLKREFNPNIQEVLYTTVKNIQLAYQFISQEVEKIFKRYVKFGFDCVKIKEDKFNKLHPYLRTELIRRAIQEVKTDLKRIEYDHWLEIESLVAFRPYGSIVNLPHSVWIKKEKGWLVVGRKNNG